MMLFSKILEGVSDPSSEAQISDDWMQGRAAFGGLGAALVYESMRKQLSATAPVRCLQISFVGPIGAEPLHVESELLREGSSVSHVLGRGIQNGQTKLVIQGSFGASRDSVIKIKPENELLSTAVEGCQKLPFIKGVMPEFTKHFDFRYATAFPFGGGDKHFVEGYVRYAEPEPEMTEAHLLGLVDAWPPATLPLMNKPAMASSLSWTIEFVQPQPVLTNTEYSLYRADIVESSNGYGHTRAKIWNEKGELLAISQQTITHFA